MKHKLYFVSAIILCAALLCACGSESASSVAAPSPAQTEAASPAQAVQTEDDGAIVVSTVDELLKSIRSDTHIILKPGEYYLSDAESYGYSSGSSATVGWTSTYDGYELFLRGVSNLTISGEDNNNTVISAAPRYANVLSLIGCSGITIENVTLGHTEEPGVCAGGVLSFMDCSDLLIDECELYGCGILGVTTQSCRNVLVRGTDIYDCSQGAASISGSDNICFDDCEIFDCPADRSSLFNIASSSEVAVINSDIRSNNARCIISADYSTGVFLGGCTIEANQTDAVLSAYGYPITVERCLFRNFSTFFAELDPWMQAENVGAVNSEGARLSEEELLRMEAGDVLWQAKESANASVSVSTAEDGAIHVSNINEFLSALGPDRTIYLEPGVYNFSDADNYGAGFTDYYRWINIFDGPGVVLTNICGLTITAAGAQEVTLAATPRYADVLKFENCSAIKLSGFTAGHTEAPGNCCGGVLSFSMCDNVEIEDCSLYGCGILGIDAQDCSELHVRGTEVYDCSLGGIRLFSSDHISLNDMNIHDIDEPDISLYSCKFVTYDEAPLYDGCYNTDSGQISLIIEDEDTAACYLTLHEALLNEDWQALADFCAYPLMIGSANNDGSGRDFSVSSREELLALELEVLFDADFCDNCYEKLRAHQYGQSGIYFNHVLSGGELSIKAVRLDPWIFSS